MKSKSFKSRKSAKYKLKNNENQGKSSTVIKNPVEITEYHLKIKIMSHDFGSRFSLAFNKYQKRGEPIHVIHRKLRDYEIRIKVNFPANRTVLDERDADMSFKCYMTKELTYLDGEDMIPLRVYFYKILK